jgi:hypothetical protein
MASARSFLEGTAVLLRLAFARKARSFLEETAPLMRIPGGGCNGSGGLW